MTTRLGELLRELRGKRSLREAAELAGVSHTYLSHLERGSDPRTGKEINPSPETLKQLADAYGHPYESLMKVAGYLPGGESDDIIPGVDKISAHMEAEYGEHDPEMAEFIRRIVIKTVEELRKRDGDER